MRGEVRQVERKKIGPRKKEVRQEVEGRGGETIRFKHSKFAHKHFRRIKKADGDYIFSCCDLLWFPALVSARPHYEEV